MNMAARVAPQFTYKIIHFRMLPNSWTHKNIIQGSGRKSSSFQMDKGGVYFSFPIPVGIINNENGLEPHFSFILHPNHNNSYMPTIQYLVGLAAFIIHT